MIKLPPAMEKVTSALAPAFTKPTHARVCVLLTAAILTVGSRTISNILRTAGSLVPGHCSTYHRILSRAKFWHWRVGKILATLVVEAFCPDGLIYLAGDDTVDEHRGPKVYGKGCHRDAVRSTHTFTAYRWGHKWIVLAILVRVPWSKRPWALPVLVTLYQPEEQNQKAGRRHKTPSELMRQMLAVLLGWFPERKFVFSGDGGYATHDLAQFAKRHHLQLTLVSRFYANANLFAALPQQTGKKNGRPRKKGTQAANSGSGRKTVRETPKTHGCVVWWRAAESRSHHRHRSLV